jgi:hypothetical protein
MPEVPDELMAQLQGAITAVCDGSLVTKWVVTAEVIDDQGEKTLQGMRSTDLPLWDQLGMLRFQTVYAQQHVESEGDD